MTAQPNPAVDRMITDALRQMNTATSHAAQTDDPRPYTAIFDHPAALAHITGIARLCLHAARRCDQTTPTTGCEALAHDHMRLRADNIARVGLDREGVIA